MQGRTIARPHVAEAPHSDLSPADFRQALGNFCSGVTAITAEGESGIHGMTATAFSSLSLNPPLILTCVDNDARMNAVLRKVRKYGVSILSEDQEAVSAHLSGQALSRTIRFEWRQGVPVVSGAMVQLVNSISARHREGDHTIYVGTVTGCWLGEGKPLLYYAGRYRRLSPE